MYKKLLLLMLPILFVSNAYATELNEALNIALNKSFKMKSSIYAYHSNKKKIHSNGLASFMPSITYTFQHKESSSTPEHPTIMARYGDSSIYGIGGNGNSGQLSLNQVLFDGGANIATLRQSNYLSEIEDINLYIAKQGILINAVNAYMKVLSATEVLKLNELNERVIKEQLLVAQKRFAVGEITKTDVSQAQARLASVTAEAIKARGNVKAANATYLRVIGEEPKNLSIPKSLPDIPRTLEESLRLAKQNNPNLRAALYALKASEQNFAIAAAKFLPTISLNASITHNDYSPQSKPEQSLAVNLSIPIFQNGLNLASMDQAKMLSKQRLYDYYETIRTIEESVIIHWENMSTALSVFKASKEAVKSTSIALAGVKQEASLNLRTTLDVLNSEQELFQTKVNLVNAESNYITSVYNLLSVIGKLNVN